MSETPTSSESPKELLKRLLKKFEQEIKEQRAITIENPNGETVGLCYLKPIAGYGIDELKIISTSSSDLLANQNKISNWLQPHNTPLVAEIREDDEEYLNLIQDLGLVAEKIGEENTRFKGMTGNLLAFRKIQKTVPYKSSKNLIYERIFLPSIRKIKEKLIGREGLELGIKITRSGMKNENRFAIEITEAGSLDHPQRKKLENLLRLYYNQLPKSRFCREFESLDGNSINDYYYLYTVKLADLFDILENKKPLAGWKPKKEIHQKYNPASNKNRFRNS